MYNIRCTSSVFGKESQQEHITSATVDCYVRYRCMLEQQRVPIAPIDSDSSSNMIACIQHRANSSPEQTQSNIIKSRTSPVQPIQIRAMQPNPAKFNTESVQTSPAAQRNLTIEPARHSPIRLIESTQSSQTPVQSSPTYNQGSSGTQSIVMPSRYIGL